MKMYRYVMIRKTEQEKLIKRLEMDIYFILYIF